PSPYFLRATIHEQKMEAEPALADLDKAIVLAPDYADAYAERGFIQLRLKADDRAFEDFTNAIRYDAMSPAGHVGRGLVYLLRNQNAQARADFDIVIRIDPMDSQALY